MVVPALSLMKLTNTVQDYMHKSPAGVNSSYSQQSQHVNHT